MNDDYPAIRFVHLLGGLRADNGPNPKVELFPTALSGKTVSFQSTAYRALFAELGRLGFGIVGTDFYSHSLEVRGAYPPDWRPYHTSTQWACFRISQKWTQIAHEAYQQQNGRLWDIGARISYQMETCAWRLRDISERYHDQLCAVLIRHDFTNGWRFDDGYTRLAYSSVQAFLVEACVLRDQLAEFVAHFKYEAEGNTAATKVTSMGKLKTKILDKTTCSDPISTELKTVTKQGGWLKELGDYRDLIVHSAPLATAGKRLMAVCSVQAVGAEELPIVVLPLPDSPDQIFPLRNTGNLFKDFEKQVEAFIGAADTPAKDALEYAHTSLGKLAALAEVVSNLSPVVPTIPTFDQKNIIGRFHYG